VRRHRRAVLDGEPGVGDQPRELLGRGGGGDREVIGAADGGIERLA
jgi:hypothetical protein